MARRAGADLEAELREHAKAIPGADRLEPFFEECRKERLWTSFAEADAEANRLQRRHRGMTFAAASFGTGALLLGLLLLGSAEADWTHARWVPWVEGALIALTALAVALGLILDRHRGWLRWRFQAEHYRLFLFHLLADPSFWRSGKPGARQLEREKLAALSHLELDALAREEPIARLPDPEVCAAVEGSLLPVLVSFYARARLDTQIAYFQRTVEREGRSVLFTSRLLAPFFLFGGVVFVLTHLVAEWAARRMADPSAREAWSRAGIFLLAVSAMLPALYAGIRTWRSANEYSRNAARAKAKLGALTELKKALLTEEDPSRVFTLLSLSESLLEAEQREWLRLMLEAEWF
jgi:hypothetical protein